MEPFKKILRTPSAFVLVITAIIALIGVIIQGNTSKQIVLIPINATATAEARLTQAASQLPNISTTSTPTQIPARKIFVETFDNNDAAWIVDASIGDFNNQGFRAFKYVQNGKYYWELESNDSFAASPYNYGSIPIPGIFEKNFCLIFDTRVYDFTGNVALVINAREIDSFKNYYFISLPNNSNGYVKVYNPQERLIATVDKNVTWLNENPHTIQVSLQDEFLKVYEVQTNSLLIETNLAEYNFLSKAGHIRFGIQLFQPNQRATAEFDNVFVYDKCPSQ